MTTSGDGVGRALAPRLSLRFARYASELTLVHKCSGLFPVGTCGADFGAFIKLVHYDEGGAVRVAVPVHALGEPASLVGKLLGERELVSVAKLVDLELGQVSYGDLIGITVLWCG
jgi:hypothetical protein